MKVDQQTEKAAIMLNITGRVQGVGFRPFIYRLANMLNLNGYVLNRPEGILIHAEGNCTSLKIFKDSILTNKPHAAEIKNIEENKVQAENLNGFFIKPSEESGTIITEISPDIAVCEDCLLELELDERRSNYPFNNCTNCGPRFSIVTGFPYDRQRTSMNPFKMCSDCREEYLDPLDRRFHAQPTSCINCGPIYSYTNNKEIISDNILSVQKISKELNQGKVIAIKSIGGFNLACDATNSAAVRELKLFKHREKKPLAVMFRSMEDIESIAIITEEEKAALTSWQRPIVILNLKEESYIISEIRSGLNTLGVFLPYLPLHYILFHKLKTNAIVLTSGNQSDTPILYDNKKATETFKTLSGGILSNNRNIVHRIDDSVLRIIAKQEVLFRRARGYVPSPVDLNFDANGILAVGAELSNCFCIGKHNEAIMSQHIGDLQNLETYDFFVENIREFSRLFQVPIKKVACDLHPDYLSTRYAEESGFDIIFTQHHHAHIASCMAEYGLKGPVIGISYDGTGLGADGNIWGSEVLVADYKDYERISHFEYVRLQGGDANVKHPWRTAIAYLFHTFGKEWKQADIPFFKLIDINQAEKLAEAIDKSINCTLGCSAGRVFDAVSALLCICTESSYHAEAPMLLENYINIQVEDKYPFSGSDVISFNLMFKEIIHDISDEVKKDIIVTKFHNTMASVACRQAELASEKLKHKTVVLSGGCFQNKYLTEKLLNLLNSKGFTVYLPQSVPINDGGIALGQLAIAANKTN